MLKKPQFKPDYAVETIEPDQIFLLSEREVVLLKDRLTYLIADLLQQGDLSVDDIVDRIQLEILQEKGLSPENPAVFQSILEIALKTQEVLFQMNNQGYLVEKDESLRPDLAIFCNHLHVAPTIAAQRLRSTKIAVKTTIEAHGSHLLEDFINILKSQSMQIADVGDREDIMIALTDDYLHPQIEEYHQLALKSASPWMLVNPLGTIIWIGPIFESHKTGCWECLAHRLRDNRPIQSFIHRHKRASRLISPPLGFLASGVQTGLSMAATEVFKWIVQGENRRLMGNLLTYDTLTLQTQDHIFVKRPQCPSCGGMIQGLEKKPLPVVLGHRQKNFIADGGHRYCSPQETLRKYRHLISPITGVVRELNKIPGTGLVHCYVAKHHFLGNFDDLDGLYQNIGGRSGGKGRSDIQAQASGFCEAIERYSGVFQGDEFTSKASYQQIVDNAIHPNDCMNFSQYQYEHREKWNAECHTWFQKVPEPFDVEREIDWTPVWSLSQQEFKYLPTAYCYYGYPQSYAPDCWADSNGCAAGNTLEEAILQGFMELVERDSVALWWYNRLPKSQVDLDSFDDPYFQSLRDYYRAVHRDLWVLDITSDLNIPTFAAISRRTDREVEDIVLGYGTHFDPRIAISRALTEANQILPNVLLAQANGSTIYPQSGDRLAIKWWKSATIANQSYLIPDDLSIPKVLTDYPQIANDDLWEDVKLCQQIVEKNGMEMLVLDQTRPDIGLRVAKVIVPGMCHMWKRLGSERLYQIPVKMGWLSEPLTEDELNPYPMWM